MTIMQKSSMTTSKDSIGTSLKVLESLNIAGALNVRENLEIVKAVVCGKGVQEKNKIIKLK